MIDSSTEIKQSFWSLKLNPRLAPFFLQSLFLIGEPLRRTPRLNGHLELISTVLHVILFDSPKDGQQELVFAVLQSFSLTLHRQKLP